MRFETFILILRCLTRPGGRMLLGIPMGYDEVQFNSNKIYGPLQMSHVLANWQQIDADIVLSEDSSRVANAVYQQPGIVVQKMGIKKRNQY